MSSNSEARRAWWAKIPKEERTRRATELGKMRQAKLSKKQRSLRAKELVAIRIKKYKQKRHGKTN